MAEQAKEIMITGGAGFIGSHTCEAFLSAGYRVVVIDNFSDYYDPAIKRAHIRAITAAFGTDRFRVYESDIRDKNALADILKRHDGAFVIHLAACAGVRPSIENPQLYYDVNVMGTLNILECMKARHMRRLIFASSSSVYGENANAIFSEDCGDNRPISPYAATKRAGELMCHTYHHIYGFSIVCLRFFTVYGPRQREDLAIHTFARRMLQGLPIDVFGDGQTMRDYTYIDDIADGIMKTYRWVCDSEQLFEIFNLGGGQPVTLYGMIAALETALGKKAIIRRQPPQTGDVTRTAADITKAVRVLGYHPGTDFDVGIKKFAEWMRNTKERHT